MRFFEPWWKLLRVLNLGPERRHREALRVMDEFVNPILEQTNIDGDYLLARFKGAKDEDGKPLVGAPDDQRPKTLIAIFFVGVCDRLASS